MPIRPFLGDFGVKKYHFWPLENGHFCQKCLILDTKNVVYALKSLRYNIYFCHVLDVYAKCYAECWGTDRCECPLALRLLLELMEGEQRHRLNHGVNRHHHHDQHHS